MCVGGGGGPVMCPSRGGGGEVENYKLYGFL